MSVRDPREYGIRVGNVIDVTIRGRVARIGHASLNIDVPTSLALGDFGDVTVYIPAEGIVRAALSDGDTTTDSEWAVRVNTDIANVADRGQIIPQSSEITARHWLDRHGGDLLRRSVTRGQWEEAPRG